MMTSTFVSGILLITLILFIVRYGMRCRQQAADRLLNPSNRARLRPNNFPFGLDIVWDIAQNARQNRVLRSAIETYQAYGNTFEQHFMGGKFINTIDPANIKSVNAINFNSFDMGQRRRQASLPLLGLGIFNNDGGQWKHSRRLFRPAFETHLLRQVEDLFEPHVQNLFAVIPGDGSVVDLSDLFLRFSMDVATQYFFGNSASTLLDYASSSASTFNDAFTRAQDRIREDYVLGWMAGLRPQAQFNRDRQVVWNFVDGYVAEAIGRQNARANISNETWDEWTDHQTVLDHMVKTSADPIELRSELLHLLLAARDTTSSLLGNLWRIVSRQTDVWAKAQEEANCCSAPPTHDALKRCKYLTNCIKETLRLWPPVPLNARTCTHATTLPTGGGPQRNEYIHVPEGMIVGWNTYALHRRKDLWGDDADLFRPGRWDDITDPGWKYLPFSGGPRRCLGQEFAMLEVLYVTVRLMQRFPRGLDSVDDVPWTEKITLTCRNLHPTYVRFK